MVSPSQARNQSMRNCRNSSQATSTKRQANKAFSIQHSALSHEQPKPGALTKGRRTKAWCFHPDAYGTYVVGRIPTCTSSGS